MRSEFDDRPPSDDLTARARIRNAAVELLGANGYDGTSIRDVAARAGVSPGLVQHHFGSKAGLREACDERVLETLRSIAQRKMERGEWDAAFVSSLYRSGRLVTRYIVRGLSEEWPSARRVFDDAVESYGVWLGREWPDRFPPDSDEAERHGATLAAMALGTLALHAHLERWLGVDPLEPGHEHVVGAAMIEVFAHMGEFLESRRGRSLRAALAEYARDVDAAESASAAAGRHQQGGTR